jgi:hypothetical protein
VKIPGINFLNTFEGISIAEIANADGMGNTLKDVVVSLILLDEARGTKVQEVAAGRFGWGRTESEKEERRRLKELQQQLRIEGMKTKQEEGQFEEKKSTGDKLKDGMEKLKLKLSSES